MYLVFKTPLSLIIYELDWFTLIPSLLSSPAIEECMYATIIVKNTEVSSIIFLNICLLKHQWYDIELTDGILETARGKFNV